MKDRPGVTSTRAVNQYRRRDTLPYLALRYYLENSAARSDAWASDVCLDQVLRRARNGYQWVSHFKDIGAEGRPTHRDLAVPGPIEALAEVALLQACSAFPKSFKSPDSVFSYELADSSDRSGAFRQYMHGLRRRHREISTACEQDSSAIVRFLDIRRFYPSIRADVASRSWTHACEASELGRSYRLLGARLLHDYSGERAEVHRGLLTGPLFSHLIANLVLRPLDQSMSGATVGYFRYVDDITLVGRPSAVVEAERRIRGTLGDLDVELHTDDSEKVFTVSAESWLEGRRDYEDHRRYATWPRLVGGIKSFLLAHPGRRQELTSVLEDSGLRLPLRDYAQAIREASHSVRVIELARRWWYRNSQRKLTPIALSNLATVLRRQYHAEVLVMLESLDAARGFERKRLIPKLRYRLARLAYLAPTEDLLKYANATERARELTMPSRIARCVATGDADQLVELGANAAQAAAQPLRGAGRRVRSFLGASTPEAEQALAILELNGVRCDFADDAAQPESLLWKFAIFGGKEIAGSGHDFVHDLALLHGSGRDPEHAELMETAYDQDEGLSWDAVELLGGSLS